MGKNTVEAKTLLEKHYGVSAPGKSTIGDWYSEFQRGLTSTEDAKRSEGTKEVIILEVIKQVRQAYRLIEESKCVRLLRLWAYQLGRRFRFCMTICI